MIVFPPVGNKGRKEKEGSRGDLQSDSLDFRIGQSWGGGASSRLILFSFDPLTHARRSNWLSVEGIGEVECQRNTQVSISLVYSLYI